MYLSPGRRLLNERKNEPAGARCFDARAKPAFAPHTTNAILLPKLRQMGRATKNVPGPQKTR